ncbi:MAG: PEP-utilizing enzyme, partial [Nitrospirota bacterium]|nr:PEP-utilizing enzyme [Nitrospirota bacterium]
TVPDPEKQLRHEQDIRAQAELVLRERLKSRHALLFPIKLFLYQWVLKNTRNAIKNRENQRFARAEAYSLVRDLIRAIGRNWHAKGILESPDDIFYLEIEEVWSFTNGTSTCTNLQQLINVRRREFEAYRLSNPEDHIETYGEVYANTDIFGKENVPDKEEAILSGTGCCRGIVEKKVQVIFKPDSSVRLNGEIMVAKQTDPGWVVLFPSVSGLIIEKGSMLSHSAIVAREMGIPTVVGVKNATRILRTGDTVRLNGGNGEIKIVQKA